MGLKLKTTKVSGLVFLVCFFFSSGTKDAHGRHSVERICANQGSQVECICHDGSCSSSIPIFCFRQVVGTELETARLVQQEESKTAKRLELFEEEGLLCLLVARARRRLD